MIQFCKPRKGLAEGLAEALAEGLAEGLKAYNEFYS